MLETVERLEMGRKLDRTAASSPDFLRMGNTWAVLNAGGKQHSLKDRLAIWARTGAKTPIDSRRSDDGNRSSGDVLIRVDPKTLSTSSAVTRENSVSAGPTCWRGVKTGPMSNLMYVGDDGIPYPVHLVGEKLAEIVHQ